MVGLVTLITEDLLVRVVLPPTNTTRTMLALPSRIVLTEITVRLLGTSLALTRVTTITPHTITPLNTKELVCEVQLDFLRGI